MKYKVELLIILFLFGGISGFLLIQPLLALQNNIFLVNGNNGTPTPCSGNTGLILAQNLTDLCDVTIISPSTNQIIQYNGSQWINVASASFTNETTVCSGQAGNYNLVVLSSGGNCEFKNLLAGSSISLSDNGTHITVTNTSPESTICANVGSFAQVYKDGNCNFRTLKGSPDISIVQGTNDITIDYNGTLASESTVCTNDGHGTGIVCNGGNVHLKGIASGSGITITQNGTDIIVTSNAINESTVCSGQSGNYNIVASSSGGNCTFKNLVAGTGESLSSNSTHITITNTGVTKLNAGTGISVNATTGNILVTNTSPESTSASNVGNGANVFKNQTGSILYFKTLLVGTGISVSNSTNTITFTNTGVISNSCVKGISCSGTNPSTFNTNFVNGTGISITGTGAQTFTNTGVTSLTSANTAIGLSASTGSITLTPVRQLLCQTVLGSANTTISCNGFTAKKVLEYTILSRSNGGTGIEPAIRFNGDSGNNYTFRTSTNGAADGTQTSTSRCNLRSNASLMGSTNSEFDLGQIYNTASERKLVWSQGVNGVNSDAGTSMTRVEMGCKWSEASNQITSITVISFSGTGNFNTGSMITVWGYDY